MTRARKAVTVVARVALAAAVAACAIAMCLLLPS